MGKLTSVKKIHTHKQNKNTKNSQKMNKGQVNIISNYGNWLVAGKN